MIVISLIPKHQEPDEKGKSQTVGQQYILQATEKEIDKISGIAEVEHIAGRIKVGHVIKVSEVYDKLDYFTRHKKKLKAAVNTLRDAANTISKVLPKEN